ncbi:MAG: entericidin A/B family lipoprotein [Planctomycetota bacterium]|nr:entericidin A/B family lipoprotein [Planctomycetota bacterium]
MSRLHKRLLLLVMLGGFAACLAVGCQTIEGAGKDISSAGRGIADVADDVKPYE